MEIRIWMEIVGLIQISLKYDLTGPIVDIPALV